MRTADLRHGISAEVGANGDAVPDRRALLHASFKFLMSQLVDDAGRRLRVDRTSRSGATSSRAQAFGSNTELDATP